MSEMTPELARLLSLPASRELDCAVARLLGYRNVRPAPGHPWGALRDLTPTEDEHHRRCGRYPEALGVDHYSTDIRAAWSALTRLVSKHWTYRCYNADGCGAGELAYCDIARGDRRYEGEVHDGDDCNGGEPMALAICRALVLAGDDLTAWWVQRNALLLELHGEPVCSPVMVGAAAMPEAKQ